MSEQFASADQLQAAAGRRRHDSTKLPVSGLRVRYQSWMEAELADYSAEVVTDSGRGTKKARLQDATRRFLVKSLVDGAGNRLYRDDQADLLMSWDTLDTQHLYDTIRKFVGLDPDHIASLVKNSEASPADGTPSGSRTD